MKQTVFGTDRAVCQKHLRRNILLCAVVFFAVIVIHAVCTLGRTEENHTLMLIANIAADIIGGSFLIARLSMCIFPQQKLLRLYDQAAQEAAGQVLEIGNTVTHYIGVDCYEVSSDVIDAFKLVFSKEEMEVICYQKENGKYQLDLWKANEIILLNAGVLKEHIEVTRLCTHCNSDRMFSHRKTGDKRGNLGAFLCLK